MLLRIAFFAVLACFVLCALAADDYYKVCKLYELHLDHCLQ
jgi:hypothetical protein